MSHEAIAEPGVTGVASETAETVRIDTRPEAAAGPSEVPVQMLDRYEIRRPLNKGGFATVYEGYDPRIKRAVAIKRCSSLDEENRERFFREAEIAGNLSHPNIVRIFDFGVADGVPFIVQELLSGKDLADCIDSGLDLSTHDRVRILLEIAEGLAYAHSHNVIHRDIKPANVRVLDDGSIKLLDFGVAAIQEAPADLTQAGTTVGTAAYLAPEQINGQRPAPATDVFSFGVLAYELLSGHRPFEGETLSAVLYQIAHQQPEELRHGAIPNRLTRLVHRCLAKQAQQRPGNFEEITEELEGILRDPRLAPRLVNGAPNAIDRETSPSSRRTGPYRERLDHSLAPAAPSARTLAAVPLQGPMRALRDSSTRIQGARRPRRARLLIALALLVGAPLYATLGGPLPETVSTAIAEVRDGLPTQVRTWLSTFEEPGPAPVAVGVPGVGAELGLTETTNAEPPLAKTTPEAKPDPVTAVVELLEARQLPVPPTTAATAAAATPPVTEPRVRRGASSWSPATVFLPPAWDPRMTVSVDGSGFQTLERRLTRKLKPGAHRLTFALDTGSYRVRRVVDVQLEPAETRTIRSPLAAPAALTIALAPKTLEGRVEIDGRSLSLPLAKSLVLEPGEHRLTLHPSPADPLGPLSKTVVLTPSSGNKVTFDMRRRRALLEPDGTFEWDGK